VRWPSCSMMRPVTAPSPSSWIDAERTALARVAARVQDARRLHVPGRAAAARR
jgi:hypothetical protein